ncbi:MAG: tetratricopeptide repeat protein [Gemmatimonadetes bacterium]|nr:tetratricopeptide repeat protein [Gemmatimonadota bacterium]
MKGANAWEWGGLLAAGIAVRLAHMWQWEQSAFGEVAVGAAAYYAGGLGDVGWQSRLYAALCAVALQEETGLWVLRVLQVSIGGLACVLVWSIGRQLFSPAVGRWAGIAAVLYGPAIYYGGEITPAVLAAFAGLLLLWGLVGSASMGPLRAGVMGAVGGVTALVDFRALFAVGAALVWVMQGSGDRRAGCWFFAGAALVLVLGGAVWGWEGLVPSISGLGLKEMATRTYLFWHGAEVLGDIDPYRAAAPSWMLAPLMWRALLGFPFGLVGPLALVGFLVAVRGEGMNRYRALPLLFVGAWMLGSVLEEASGRSRLSAALFLLPGALAAIPLLLKKRQRVWGIALALVLLAANFPIAAGAQSSHDTWAGYAYRELDMNANAIAAYERAIEAEDAGIRPYAELARIYFDTGAYEHAAEIYHSLVQRHAVNRDIWIALAESYLRAGRAEEAAAIYADLVAKENEPSLAGRLGDARAAQGALEDAIAAYQTVVAVWPDSHRVRFQLARTWEQQAALDSAAVHYGIIVGLAEWEGLVGWRLAQVLGRMEKDNLGRIEKLLRDVLADHPDSAPALLCMAGLLHRTGRNEEALMHLQRIAAMHPDEYRAYGLMESVYRAMGRPEEAGRAAELYREKRLRQRADRRVLGNLEALLQGGTP